MCKWNVLSWPCHLWLESYMFTYSNLRIEILEWILILSGALVLKCAALSTAHAQRQNQLTTKTSSLLTCRAISDSQRIYLISDADDKARGAASATAGSARAPPRATGGLLRPIDADSVVPAMGSGCEVSYSTGTGDVQACRDVAFLLQSELMPFSELCQYELWSFENSILVDIHIPREVCVWHVRKTFTSYRSTWSQNSETVPWT